MNINADTPLREARATLAAAYDLAPSMGAARDLADRYERVKRVIPEAEWA